MLRRLQASAGFLGAAAPLLSLAMWLWDSRVEAVRVSVIYANKRTLGDESRTGGLALRRHSAAN